MRERDLQEDLPAASFSGETKELFLLAVEQIDFDELVRDLTVFEKASKALQGQGKTKETPRLTFAQSRAVLDKRINHFPRHNFTKITKNGPLVTHPTWKSATVKLYNNQEDRLNATEKREVKIFSPRCSSRTKPGP